MRVWIVCVGEAVPVDPGKPRLLRAGLLAKALVDRGHEVVWWNSTVDHYHKRVRARSTTVVRFIPGYKLWLLHGTLYKRNVSAARLLNHWQIAREFRRLAPAEARPDIIVASMPTIELAYEAVRYGRCHGVPVVVDVRDFWPDVWEEVVPMAVRRVQRLLLVPYDRMLRWTLRHADALTSFSEGGLLWALQRAGRTRHEWDRSFPHGAPFIEISQRNASVHSEYRHIVFAGSITERTGTLTFLETFASVSGNIRDRFIISIAGTGPKLEDVRELCASRDLRNVALLGWLDQLDLARLYARADIGLLPYPRSKDFQMALPNKFCEYLAYELPVLTTLTGQVERELQRNGAGIIYGPHNVRSLEKALERLLDGNFLDGLKAKARTASSNFRAATVYERFAQHLECIVAKWNFQPAADHFVVSNASTIRSDALPPP